MADRIEREIEEILSRLGDDQPPAGRQPIPIKSGRRRKQHRGHRIQFPWRIDPPVLMFAGAGVMLVGLVLSAFAGWLIWVAFAGVLMFLAAFFVSFARGWPKAPNAQSRPSAGVFWRDRYIRYDEPEQGPLARIKRKFRR